MRMFRKILVANRGEIACRVIRTCHAMDIKTVAVFSDADNDALHVQMADEAVNIGPALSTKSYLSIEKIVRAAQRTKVDAVHPGYGFLSENKEFRRALTKAGIVFIGPNARAIEAMGDKIAAKKIARKAGVKIIPGYIGVIKDYEEAIQISRDIGYPVMLKASAGGGGKGMRVATSDAEVEEGFERATSEARSSFGDERVFIEKFIEEPRHIEIQILSDKRGHTIYLGERECSIQRRHQKVIEEAPSPFLDERTRRSMGRQAVALAKAVKYVSAGTVEFIVDAQRKFYFLEMNTRLQVEHPVTELVTGLDLVEWMIRIAAGEKLALKQSSVRLNGSAIESRIYAEDPYRDFLPSTGRLVSYLPPTESKNVRVDSGVCSGGEISMYYDPMMAKLCTWGKTRSAAITQMRRALDAYYIRGVSHNIPFVAAVMRNKRFVRSDLSTNFITEEYPNGFSGVEIASEDRNIFIAVAGWIHNSYADRSANISGQLMGHGTSTHRHWIVCLNGKYHAASVVVNGTGTSSGTLKIGRSSFQIESNWTYGAPLFEGSINGIAICVQVDRLGIGYRLFRGGSEAEATVYTIREAELQSLMPQKPLQDFSKYLMAPMPGLLVSVQVEEGQTFKAGDSLAMIEAMKMENTLRAERDGVVKKVSEQPGASVAVDQIIIEFE